MTAARLVQLSLSLLKKDARLFLVAVFILIVVTGALGATRYSVNTGNWGSTSTWSATSGGSGGASVPVAGDIVYIEGNKTVTVAANAACSSVSIATGSTLSVGGVNLTVSGTTTVSGTLICTSSMGTKTMGNVIMSGGTWTSNAGETYAITTVTLSGSTFNGSATGAFTISSTLTVTAGTTNTFNAAAITVSGATTIHGSLNFASSTGTKTFIGALTINSGGTWNSSGNSAFTIRGGITNSGTFTSGTGVYTFNTNSQNLSGSISIANMTVTGVTVTNTGTLYITASLIGTGGLTNAANSTLHLDYNGSVSITTLTATAAGNTVDYGSTGAQNIRTITYVNLQLSGSNTKTLAGNTTVQGNLTVSGTSVSSTCTLNPASFNLSVSGTTTIHNFGIFNDNNNLGVNTFTGAVALNGTGTWNSTAVTTAANLNFVGGITHNGSADFSAYTATFSASQSIQVNSSGNIVFNTGATAVTSVSVTANLSIQTPGSGSFQLLGAGSFIIGAGVTVTNQGNTIFQQVLSGSNASTSIWLNDENSSLTYQNTIEPMATGVMNASATGNTIEYNGTGSQTVKNASYYNLALSNSRGSNTISIGTIEIAGSFTNSASFTSGTGITASSVTYNGTAAQTLLSTGTYFEYTNLGINNAAGVSLNNDVTVNGTVSFTNGRISTGNNSLILENSAQVSGAGAGKYVYGNLVKGIAGGTSSITFETGDATVYAPLTIYFTGTTNSTGTIKASTTAGEHPLINLSALEPSRDVNRYWTLTNTGVTGFTSFSIVFSFNGSDLDPGVLYQNLVVGRYSSGWSYPVTGAITSTSIEVTSLNEFGDFQAGECSASVQPGEISGNLTPCNGQSDLTYSVNTINGQTFSWTLPAGWTITSGQGTNSIVVTAGASGGIISVTSSNGCSESSAQTLTVSILSPPSVSSSISGPLTPCSGSTGLQYSVDNVNGITYTWSLPPGWTQTAGSNSHSITVSAGSAGGYIYVTPSNECGSAASAYLPVAAQVSPTLTSSSSQEEICSGQSIQLTAEASPASPQSSTILSEGFNEAANNWITFNNTVGGSTEEAAWTLRPDGYSSTYSGVMHSNDATQFYFSNSDAPGSSSVTSTILQSPPISTLGYSSLTLSFYHYFRVYLSGETGKVQVSTDGSTWTDIVTYTSNTGSSTSFASVSLNLNAYAGFPYVFIRFKYDAAWGYYWAIDNVSLTGTPGTYNYLYNWTASPSGTSGLPAGAGTPSSSNGTVTATPTATTTFTAWVSNGGHCSSSSNTAVVVQTAVNASVSITESANSVCSGTQVTFTAIPVNGGISPQYQWKINGVNAGTNASTFSSSALADGDIVSCEMTSSVSCVTGSPATSNPVVMDILPLQPASISISASQNPSCQGSMVTFTATAVNGGTTPSYQWKVNGVNIGTNSPAYSSNSLSNNDIVSCVLTSNAVCSSGSPATSNAISMAISANVPVSVTIGASATTICQGSSVTFTATPVNGGSSPSYQWLLNGTAVGTNSSTYTSSSLNNNDLIKCELTSIISCVSGNPATSNQLTMTVNQPVPVSVSIAATSTSICSGETVTFTATPVNGGSSPTYQWKRNGINVGTNNPAYSTNSLVNNDIISCTLQSNATCISGNPAVSNSISMTVQPVLPVSVSIGASATTICSGTSVTFTATPSNGGSSPTYQWKVNGDNAGTNSAGFTSSSLVNGDVVQCVMTSNASCVSGNPATSGSISMTVNPLLPVSVSIAASENPICSGIAVTFTATPVNGGASPSYQWKNNGINVGTNNSSYTASSLSNNDIITCVITSNASCITGSPATSNALAMTVYPVISSNTADYTYGLQGVLCATANENNNASITAPAGTVFINVGFASYGTPTGSCPSFSRSSCHSATSQSVTETYLLGNNSAVIPATNAVFGDPCVGTYKRLYIKATYTQPICAGTDPGMINGSTPSGGNGTYSYLWERSITGPSSGFTTATGVNNQEDYSPGILNQTTWFRRRVTSGGCSDVSTVVMIKVNPVISNNLITDEQTICEGSVPAILSGSLPSGGNSSYTYLWESSTVSGTSGFIAAQGTNTLQSYTPSALSQTTWFRRVVTSGGCTHTSTAVKITVTPTPTAGITYPGDPFCLNSGLIQVNQSGTTGGTFSSNPAGLNLHSTSGEVNTLLSQAGTYTITYLIAASGGCDQVTASTELTIHPLPEATISGNATVCPEATPPVVTFTGSGASPPYTFAYTLNGGAVQYISSTAGSTALLPVATGEPGTYVYTLQGVSSSTGCTQGQSGTATVTIHPNPEIEDDAPSGMCQYTIQMVTASVNGGSGNYSYAWQVLTPGASGLFVPGSTSNDFIWLTTYGLSPGTYEYQLTVTDLNWGCVKVKHYSMEVLPNISPNWVSNQWTACSGQAGSIYTVQTNPLATYAWAVSGGTISSGQGTSSISVEWGNPGTGQVSVTATIGNCSQVLDHSVTIYALPTITLGANPEVCSGVTAAQLSYTSVTGNPNRYSVDFNAAANAAGFVDVTNAILSSSPIGIAVPASAPPGTYSATLSVLNNSTGCSSQSYPFQVVITANLPVSVGIESSMNPSCTGASVSFTATPVHGGSSPIYQWQVNGVNTGTNSNIFTSTDLSNNDQVSCILTSSEQCVSGNPATSNLVTMTVNPTLVAGITIDVSQNPVCSGTPVTFTATAVNGGSNPVYQWSVNGSPAGINDPVFSSDSFNDGDLVSCQLTSSEVCISGSPATSNQITMEVDPILPVSVSVAASANPVCSGTLVTFTATAINGGAAATYEWFRNGIGVGSNSSGYSASDLSDGDVVSCRLTGSENCSSGNPAMSNEIVMSILPNLEAAVTIQASTNPICEGSEVTFTASAVNGGSNPVFQWKLNGENVGTNSPVYSTNSLENLDMISCVMTSNEGCITGNPATSNTITMTVNPNMPVSVSIVSGSGTAICSGTQVQFIATPVNGGVTPSYQWKKNGTNVGTNSSVYTDAYLNNGDQVVVILTSSLTCTTGNPATSNILQMAVTTTPSSPSSVTINPSAIYSDHTGQVELQANGGGCEGAVLKWYAGSCGGGSLVGTGTPLSINPPAATTTYFARWENGSCYSNCASASLTVYANYRSKASGNWDQASTWEKYSAGSWIAATSRPVSTDGTIRIRDGHTVTVAASGSYINVDEFTIETGGKLIVNVCPSNWWFNVVNGPGTDITVNGTMEYQDDKVSMASGATMVVGDGGVFQHNLNYAGNYPITAPTATWHTNSTYEVLSSNQLAPAAGLNQIFGNFTWNSQGQTADINLGGALTRVTGNLSILSTGTNKLILANTTALTLTIDKDLLIQNGTLDISSGSSATKQINLYGNFSQTGGTFTNTNSTPATISFFGTSKSFSQAGGVLTSTYLNWEVKAAASLSLLSNIQVPAGRTFTLRGILDCNSRVLSGAGGFVMTAGAGILLGDPSGISSVPGTGNIQTTTCTIPAGCDFTYNAGASQVTGNRLPATVRNLTIQNSSGVSLSSPVTISGQLSLVSGEFLPGNQTLGFQNADIPIVKTGGTITTSTGTNLSFGTPGYSSGAAFTLPEQLFNGSAVINNLSVYRLNGITLNSQGMSLRGVLFNDGPLTTGGRLTLLSGADQTALIDGSGNGQIIGQVSMQRYVPRAYGYRYISSPFQSATVGAFSPYVDLQAAFPAFYSYDEDKEVSGWTAYTDPSGTLFPMKGYAANLGTSAQPTVLEYSGIVNNNLLTPVSLYNHNHPYTLGFNLAGNPYPSPIDWNAPEGWTKQQIDDALYFFDPGIHDPYTGTYSSFINGVSSNGIASGIIPSMQGFFVHVSDGAYPVIAALGMDNRVRVNDLSPAFHKSGDYFSRPLIRLSAAFAEHPEHPDYAVVYFEDPSTPGFDKDKDALKILNTDTEIPSLFIQTNRKERLSINALPETIDSLQVVPLGMISEKEGYVEFSLTSTGFELSGFRIYLVDSVTGIIQDMEKSNHYRFFSGKGEVCNRFALVFSYNNLEHIPPDKDAFDVYLLNSKLHVFMDLSLGTRAQLVVSNMLGQTVFETGVIGSGHHDFDFHHPGGIYVVSLHAPKGIQSRKIYIPKR